MYAGNLVGLLVQGLVHAFVPDPLAIWQVADTGDGELMWLQTILLAFAAPVMEEFVFRRCVINHLKPYGEKAALVISALLFALFHGSVNQVFYAFGLGLVFGYIYLKTGRVRYSMILHVIINATTMIILPALITLASGAANETALYKMPLSEAIRNPGVLLLILFICLLLVLSLFGSVIFFFGVRERELSPDGIRMKTPFTSWGILVFLAAAVSALL